MVSVLMLVLGGHFLNNHLLLKVGKKAHAKKMASLDKIWPLTKIQSLINDGNKLGCHVILSFLIFIKSFLCFFFGMIVIFCLPIACFVVPSIIHIHNPDDPKLQAWIFKVSLLQVTSHTFAASIGASLFFTLNYNYSFSWNSAMALISGNLIFIILALFTSFIFAVVAGHEEMEGIMKRGI